MRLLSDTEIMVGRIIIPRRRDAVRTELPFPPNAFLTKGTITMSPKKPYTTLGIPASRSIPFFKGPCSPFGQNLERNIAVMSPIGTPKRIAPAVTYTLPAIMGKIPNVSFPGFHFCPIRKSMAPIL